MDSAYPWGVCIARFVARTAIGAVIGVLALVLWFLSALPYGGSGSEFMRQLLYCAGLCLPWWALCGLIPPAEKGNASRTLPTAIVVVLSLLWAIAFLSGALSRKVDSVTGLDKLREEDQQLGARRQHSIDLCKADLKKVSAPIVADSLLIDTGVIESRTLQDLLGRRGLRSVELRPYPSKAPSAGPPAMTVAMLDGDQASRFQVADDVAIVRLSLGQKGDPACTAFDTGAFGLDTDRAPFSPDACLRVELVKHSRASHVLKAVVSDQDATLLKWALLETATHSVLAALTSRDAASSPGRQGGGSADELKKIGDDMVSCLEPHFSLMNLVYGPPRAKQARLSLGKRTIPLQIDAALLATSASWKSVPATETLEAAWDTKKAARSGPAWSDGFREAERTGWGSYAEGVIDFGAGELVVAERKVQALGRPEVRATRHGFLLAFGQGGRIALAQFSLDGRLLWKRMLVPPGLPGGYSEGYGVSGLEWSNGEVRIYLTRGKGNGQKSDVTVVTVVKLATPPAADPP